MPLHAVIARDVDSEEVAVYTCVCESDVRRMLAVLNERSHARGVNVSADVVPWNSLGVGGADEFINRCPGALAMDKPSDDSPTIFAAAAVVVQPRSGSLFPADDAYKL